MSSLAEALAEIERLRAIIYDYAARELNREERIFELEQRPTPIAAEIAVSDRVEKWTGDYTAEGEVRAVYTTFAAGPVRYMVALDRITSGHIMHTLSRAQIRRLSGGRT